MSNPQKINYIRSMLASFSSTAGAIPTNAVSEKVFELFCYFRKVEEFAQTGKSPRCVQTRGAGSNVFLPNFAPGITYSGDYFALDDPHGGTELDLILNGTYRGQSEMEHSPDIVLLNSNSDKVVSLYECKNYSHTLGPNVYREFIGYCKEFGVVGSVSNLGVRDLINTYTVLAPCIYTSAPARPIHKYQMFSTYNVRVYDLM